MVTPQTVISYLNTLIRAALAAGASSLYFPLMSSKYVTANGIQEPAVHPFQGRLGDPIKAAFGVLDLALRGTPRLIEKFRAQYADWEGPGKPPAWYPSVEAALSAMGAFRDAATPAPPPPVVTPPPPQPPPPGPTPMTTEQRLDALEARVHALDGK